MSHLFSKSFWVRESTRAPSRILRINNIGQLDGDALLSNSQTDDFPSNEIITSKYTGWNFLLKNLFEQFMRVANFYFLIIAIILVVNNDSPVSPATSIIPLIFVLSVTALKQGYEDWLRHNEDSKLNNKTFQVVRLPGQNVPGKKVKKPTQNEASPTEGDAQLVRIQSKHIRVGDIVAVEQNEAFPCDMVLLATSNVETGECYVTTAGLDGESNLKTFVALPETRHNITAQQLATIRGCIQCEQPIEDLYSFKGKILLDSDAGGARHSLPTPTSATNGYGTSAARASNPNVAVRPLSAQNVLLRGACLKNTDFVFGCVVYTGAETKMSLNSKSSRVKFSRVERMLNIYLLIVLLVMLIFVFGSFIGAIVLDSSPNSMGHWYIDDVVPSISVTTVLIEWVSFLTLYNYVIPISLYVTIELQKFFGSLFFAWDVDMYDADSGERAKANTSDLNEELGQIQYLFSDKTGTLTENMMQFRQCSIAGEKLLQKENANKLTRARDNEPATVTPGAEIWRFLVALALCHTVRVEHADVIPPLPGVLNSAFVDDRGSPAISAAPTPNGTLQRRSAPRLSVARGDSLAIRLKTRHAGGLTYSPDGSGYEYQASSPDEKAFLDAARQLGFVFHGTQNAVSVLTALGKRMRFRLLHVLEFDSTRKCMSVVMQDLNGSNPHGWLFGSEFFVLCKGAETAMIQRVSSSNDRVAQDVIMQHVGEFAGEGLRTLVFGFRPLSVSDYTALDNSLKTAALRLADRDEALQKAYTDVEKQLQLLGASGVEDRLQPDVAETIIALRRAGISVWVLTGDKEETAVNIAYSCGLFDTTATCELRITRQTDVAQCSTTILSLMERIEAEPAATMPQSRRKPAGSNHYYGLIADGASLAFLLNDEQLRNALLQLCLKCSAVLCCRVTPLQKAQVVKLIKDGVPGAVTAAIGDGANDVSMIQEAHVGIGIFGKEGRQAARCSDYCFPRFRSLQRCLLLHGHWYYHRIVLLIQYFFYKNITFILPQFFYIFFSTYSATSVYDTLTLTLYNVTMTTLPIIVVGLFERHLPERLLLSHPELYKRISCNVQMRVSRFIWWIVLALYDSLVIFFSSYMLFGPSPNNDVGYTTPLSKEQAKALGASSNFTFGTHDQFGSGTESTLPDGLPMDPVTFGTFIITLTFFAVNGQLALRVRTWTVPVLFAFAFTIFGFFVVYILYEAPFWKFAISSHYIFLQLLSYPVVWLHLTLILLFAWLPDLLNRARNDVFSKQSLILTQFRQRERAQRDKLTISVTKQSGSLEPASATSSKLQSAQQLYDNYDRTNNTYF